MTVSLKNWSVLAVGLALAGCVNTPADQDGGNGDVSTDGTSSGDSRVDAAADSSPDAQADAAREAGSEAGAESGPASEAGPDGVAPDAGPDAVAPDGTVPDGTVPETGLDGAVLEAGAEAGVDAGPEASVDAGPSVCSMTTQPAVMVGSMVMGSLMGAGTMSAQSCQPMAPGAEAYYPVTVTARATVSFATTGMGDTILSLRRNCTDAATELGCNDDSFGAVASTLRVVLDPGTYYLVVDSYTSTTAALPFGLNVSAAPVAANGTCATAAALAPGATLSNVDSSGAPTAALCSDGTNTITDPALWYSLRVPASSSVTVTATPGGATGVVDFLTSTSCDPTTVCNSGVRSAPGAAVTQTLVNATATAQTYYVMVAGNAAFNLAASAPATVHTYAQTTIASACVPTAGFTAAPGFTPGDDVTSTAVMLPTPLTNYFGTTVDRFVASSNGWLQLGSATVPPTTSTEYDNDALPTAAGIANLVAPFWDDLHDAPGSALTYGSATVSGTSRFVIDWTNWRTLDGTDGTDSMHFQVHLVPSTNIIEFHYCSLAGSDTRMTGNSATVGLQDATGAVFVQVGFEMPLFTLGTPPTPGGYRFTPSM